MSDKSNPMIFARIVGLVFSTDDPRVISLDHTEYENGGKSCELLFWDGDFALMDNSAIREGVEVQWRYGYPENLSPQFVGVIGQLEPNFGGGEITLKVTAFGTAEMKMMQTRRKRSYMRGGKGLTESDAVSDIAALLGLVPDIEPTK